MEALRVAKRLAKSWIEEDYYVKFTVMQNGKFSLIDALDIIRVKNPNSVVLDNPLYKHDIKVCRYLDQYEDIVIPKSIHIYRSGQKPLDPKTGFDVAELSKVGTYLEGDEEELSKAREQCQSDIMATYNDAEGKRQTSVLHQYTFQVFMHEDDDEVRILMLELAHRHGEQFVGLGVHTWSYQNGWEEVYRQSFFDTLRQLRLF